MRFEWIFRFIAMWRNVVRIHCSIHRNVTPVFNSWERATDCFTGLRIESKFRSIGIYILCSIHKNVQQSALTRSYVRHDSITREIWFMTHEAWLMTHDSCLILVWHMTHDSWGITHDSYSCDTWIWLVATCNDLLNHAGLLHGFFMRVVAHSQTVTWVFI